MYHVSHVHILCKHNLHNTQYTQINCFHKKQCLYGRVYKHYTWCTHSYFVFAILALHQRYLRLLLDEVFHIFTVSTGGDTKLINEIIIFEVTSI